MFCANEKSVFHNSLIANIPVFGLKKGSMKRKNLKNRKDDLFVALCAHAGIKATQQRREIYRELAASKEHPDVDMVYKHIF